MRRYVLSLLMVLAFSALVAFLLSPAAVQQRYLPFLATGPSEKAN